MPARVLFRVDFALCQRSRGGDAVKLSAYNACARIQHGGKVYDFRRKRTEHVGKTLLLTPAGYPTATLSSPGALWRAAEAAEKRCDSQTARQILLTIPREVPPELREDLVRHVVRPWVDDGMTAQVDLHAPSARDGDEQPHAHVLLTMRDIEGGGFAAKKLRGTAWNRAFTEHKGRAMRAAVADRMNTFFREHSLELAVDHRTNFEADGPAALPPEPQVARNAIETAKRNPGATPAVVADLDRYRRDRRRLRDFDANIAAAEAKAAQLRQRINAARQERKSTMKEQDTPPEPWTTATGPLSSEQQQQAQSSYERWRNAQLNRGRPANQIFGLDQYVGYVRDQRRDRATPTPAGNPDAVFARTTRRDREPGFSRRHRFLANLLAEHYDVSRLDASVAENIVRIRLDRDARTATVYLRDGTHFIDHGDRIQFHGEIAQSSANEIAAAAGRHAWTHVQLTGTDRFKDEVAIALGLREPPIAHDHNLSPVAAQRLAQQLRMRASIKPTDQHKETSHDAVPDSIRPAVPSHDGATAAGHRGDAGAGAGGGGVLATPSSRIGAAAVGLVSASSDDAAGAGGGDGGVDEASDDEILMPLLAWLEPRAAEARRTLDRRPAAERGNTRGALASQRRQHDFDSSTVAERARIIIATQAALTAEPPDADLLDAVRRSGDPLAAENEMRRRQTQEPAQRQELEQAHDEVSRPRI